MASQLKVVVNSKSVEELLKVTVVPLLEEKGRSIANAAGPGHRVETTIGPRRARVAVITDTFEAMHAEATSRSLTRAIDAGR